MSEELGILKSTDAIEKDYDETGEYVQRIWEKDAQKRAKKLEEDDSELELADLRKC